MISLMIRFISSILITSLAGCWFNNHISNPVVNPQPGIYTSDQTVTIICNTADAVIHYTTDGSDPSPSSPVYLSPISILGPKTTMTIKAMTIKNGLSNSGITKGTYTINYSMVSHVAGPLGGIGIADGPRSYARFWNLVGLTSDGENLYVTDNHAVRKIEISTGLVSTLAGKVDSSGELDGKGSNVRFNNPSGITSDGKNLYVADTDNRTIRMIVISTGEVTDLSKKLRFNGSKDGIDSYKRLMSPYGITNDGENLYVTSGRNVLKIVTSSGVVTTILNDNSDNTEKVFCPSHITHIGNNLYVTDTYRIRQISLKTGKVTTLAGNYGKIGAQSRKGSNARLNCPSGITNDGTHLYVTDNHTVHQIVISTGEITNYVTTQSNKGINNELVLSTRFDSHNDIVSDGKNLYVIDSKNIIRKIVISSKEIAAIAGVEGGYGSRDGIGSTARFKEPYGITCDGTNLYITDTENHKIRKIAISTEEVTTLVGEVDSQSSTDDLTHSKGIINRPLSITSDENGIYFSDGDTIRMIVSSTREFATLAGDFVKSGSTDGIGVDARFHIPSGIISDGINLYLTDSGNRTVRKIEISSGQVTTLAGSALNEGVKDSKGSLAGFLYPSGIIKVGSNLYVTDIADHTIRKVDISTGVITILAGHSGSKGSADGMGSRARFSSPYDITSNQTHLFVSDTENHTIRKIAISTGEVTTIAGTVGVVGSSDGRGLESSFNEPHGICYCNSRLYVVDSGNHAIRRIDNP